MVREWNLKVIDRISRLSSSPVSRVIIISVGCVSEVCRVHWPRSSSNLFLSLGLDWKTHENNYYECSKYRGQPQSQLETIQSRAREALKKYLHYFERVRNDLLSSERDAFSFQWDNHQRSLKLEEQTRAKLLEKINHNINAQNGTYIDWQYLEKAADSLAKVRFSHHSTARNWSRVFLGTLYIDVYLSVCLLSRRNCGSQSGERERDENDCRGKPSWRFSLRIFKLNWKWKSRIFPIRSNDRQRITEEYVLIFAERSSSIFDGWF